MVNQSSLNELALFAGAGGGILGGELLGWRTVCAVERDAYASQVLARRQNNGILKPFPIWSDVQTFDGKPWRGIVDVVSGGFPCQDISCAGRGAGIKGERSGMWKEMARIIGEVRPLYVFVENSPMLTSRGLGTVLGDLAEIGFDAEWGVLSAADVGANHLRERIWILAKWRGQLPHAQHKRIGRWEQQQKSIKKENGEVAYTNGTQFQRAKLTERSKKKHPVACPFSWWEIEPDVGRVADGVAFRVDRLKAIGNGQVPRVAATAFNLLHRRIND